MDNEVDVCPYNSAHIISRKRMQYHLIKCAKSYPEIHLESCPFNARHRIPPEELDNHIKECDSTPSDFDELLSPKQISHEYQEGAVGNELKHRVRREFPFEKFINVQRVRPLRTCPSALSVCGLNVKLLS